jgi:hypothetical protein
MATRTTTPAKRGRARNGDPDPRADRQEPEKVPVLGKLIDERFLSHRRRAERTAGLAGTRHYWREPSADVAGALLTVFKTLGELRNFSPNR